MGGTIWVDGDRDGILINSNSAWRESADGFAGIAGILCYWREIDGGNSVRTGVGDDREVCFLIDGYAAGSCANSNDDRFRRCGIVQDWHGVDEINHGDGVGAVIGDHGDARGSGRLPDVSKAGKNGDTRGGGAGLPGRSDRHTTELHSPSNPLSPLPPPKHKTHHPQTCPTLN